MTDRPELSAIVRRSGRAGTQRRRIAVITDDVLAAKMAGPAIRALHIAEALAARQHTVELISTARCDYTHPA